MIKTLSFLFIISLMMGCGLNTSDLSGGWNDIDSRMVAEEMIHDCLNHPWLNTHGIGTGNKPVVIIGNIWDEGMADIPVEAVMLDMERAFINTGKIRVVSGSNKRQALRAERAHQSEFASLETVKQMGRELGAHYMMTGEIKTIKDREDGEQVIIYQTELMLTNIETNKSVWIGQKEIKKFIERSKFKM